MNNWKVIFATVVIFGAGVLTGGLLVNYVQQPNLKPKPKPASAARLPATNSSVRAAATIPKPRPPEILSKQFLQQLDAELRLTPGQRDAIQKIINEGQNLMRKVVQDARLEIRELLTPEQLKQFDELMKRPFLKPIFSTNGPASTAAPPSKFQNRLEQIIARPRTNVDLPSNSSLSPEAQRARIAEAISNLSPEEQLQLLEKSRISSTNSLLAPPVPPQPILPVAP